MFLNSRSPGEQVKCETCSGNHYSAVSGIFCHPGEYIRAQGLIFAREGLCLELGGLVWDSCLEHGSFAL